MTCERCGETLRDFEDRLWHQILHRTEDRHMARISKTPNCETCGGGPRKVCTNTAYCLQLDDDGNPKPDTMTTTPGRSTSRARTPKPTTTAPATKTREPVATNTLDDLMAKLDRIA